MFKSNALRVAEFLELKAEVAEHVNTIAEVAGLLAHCDTTKGEDVYAQFLENLSAFYAHATIESAIYARTQSAVQVVEANLTARQSVIVGEIMLGKSNKEIAVTVGYATSTVHHEVTAILAFFKIKNREQLAEYGLAALDESPPPPLLS